MFTFNYSRIFIILVVAVVVIFFWTQSTISALTGSEERIDSKAELLELTQNSSNGRLSVFGTPDLLFKYRDSEGNSYFALQEFDFSLIVKIKGEYSQTIPQIFSGSVTSLRNISNNSEVLENLNFSLSNKLSSGNLQLSENQLEEIRLKTSGSFSEQTILLNAIVVDNLTTGLIIAENVAFGIFLSTGLIFLFNGIHYKRIREE